MFKKETKQSLQGKAAIVTGSSRGLGSAIARLFHSEGASVVLTARNKQSLESLSRELNGACAYSVSFVMIETANYDAPKEI